MRLFNQFHSILAIGLLAIVSSCTLSEDPGPIQYNEEVYAVIDFDRLDIGDAMQITVQKGPIFEVFAKGDRRNLDDLEIKKVGNTLVAQFSKNRNRKHTTYITVTMPELLSGNFYGATTSSIIGFEEDIFTINLSGASYSQVDVQTNTLWVNLSGASNLSVSGYAEEVFSDVSGASLLKSYNLLVEDYSVKASGASHAYVRANRSLIADASGASSILYRGDAVVSSKTTGASSILKD